MDLTELQQNWEGLAKQDPLWSILTSPDKKGNRWGIEEFWKTGTHQIESLLGSLKSLRIALRYRRAMDFGCGVGRLTRALTPYFEEVCGVDISSTMIDLAQRWNANVARCHYYLNQSDYLRVFPDASFDFAVSLLTLQHMEPRYSLNYLKEFLRVLRPGGVLVFQLPAEAKTATIIRHFIRDFCPKPIIDFYRYKRSGASRMEMYSIHLDKITGFLEENGGSVLEARQEPADGYVSYTYYVVKRNDVQARGQDEPV